MNDEKLKREVRLLDGLRKINLFCSILWSLVLIFFFLKMAQLNMTSSSSWLNQEEAVILEDSQNKDDETQRYILEEIRHLRNEVEFLKKRKSIKNVEISDHAIEVINCTIRWHDKGCRIPHDFPKSGIFQRDR